MNVPSQITPAEMREALRLNLDLSNLWKLLLRRNLRIVFVLIIILFASFARVAVIRPVDWSKIGFDLALVGACGLIILLNHHLSAAKYAKAINKASSTFIIDARGLSQQQPNGTCTSIPWSAIPRWREGNLVFTIGPTANYSIVSKAVLGHMQAGELRSTLLAQVRGNQGMGNQFAQTR